MLTPAARAEFRTPTGRLAKVPARVRNQPGLDAGRIARLRHRAEKMSRKNNASFATIFFAKVIAALSEHGYVNISIRQVMQLAQQANEMPPELALACGCFIAAHPPATDFHGMQTGDQARPRSAGCPRWCNFTGIYHRSAPAEAGCPAAIEDAQADQPAGPLAAGRAREAQSKPPRPRRGPSSGRLQLAALERLYPIRHRFKPWQVEFLECVEALRKSGFGMVPWQAEQMLELEREQQMSAA